MKRILEIFHNLWPGIEVNSESTSIEKRSRFFAGWELDFYNRDELTKFLLTHGTNAAGFEFFRELQSAMVFLIEGDKIVQARTHSLDITESVTLDIALPLQDWPDREVFLLVKDSDGNHSIGGKRPTSFSLPHHESLQSNFIYLGSLDCTDPRFEWMKLKKLHMAYPVYEGAFKLFLDYQDPDAPVLLNPEALTYSWIDDTVKGTERVQYSLQRYSSIEGIKGKEFVMSEQEYLICGVPLWYQYPEIPTCPKSGRVMRFVMAVSSDINIAVQDDPEIANLPFDNYMIFGDEGHLYVFYEPESKVLCLNVQF